MTTKTKILIGILVVIIIVAGGWCIWSSQVYPESETRLKPIEKLTKKFFIKEITVYEDHIVIQIDKDWVESENLGFFHGIFLGTKDPSTYRLRQGELIQTGRAELQVGEAIAEQHAHYTYSAFLKEIKGEIAYIEVKEVYSDIGVRDIKDEYTVEIDKIYISKRPEDKK